MAQKVNILTPDPTTPAIDKSYEVSGEKYGYVVKEPGSQYVLVNNSVEAVFNELYSQWQKETEYNSFIGSQTNGIYEKIVQLGDPAVPYIINKIKEEDAHLFIALCKITGQNPVKKENRGNVKKMAKDWIDWWENVLHGNG